LPARRRRSNGPAEPVQNHTRLEFRSASIGSLDAVSIGNLGAAETLSISDPQNNQIINGLHQQYVEYARREREYSARYGSDHLAVVNLRTTMKSIRQSILDEVRRLAEISKSDFDVAKERQQEIERQLAQAISQSRNTSSAELSIRELENSAKGYRSLYERFLQSYMGSLRKGHLQYRRREVISPAAPPAKKEQAQYHNDIGVRYVRRDRARHSPRICKGDYGPRRSNARPDRSEIALTLFVAGPPAETSKGKRDVGSYHCSRQGI
jgi:hypothetical protein